MEKSKVDWNNLVSSQEAAKIFGKNDSYFRKLANSGKLTENIDFKKFGTTWVFSLEALEKYFKK